MKNPFAKRNRRAKANLKAQLATALSDLREERSAHQRSRTFSHQDHLDRARAVREMQEAQDRLSAALARIRELEGKTDTKEDPDA